MSIELIVTIVVAVTGILGYIFRKKILENKAIEALWVGIQAAEDKLVSFLKKANEDGQLTPEEIQQAKDLAIAEAFAFAKGPVKDILIAWGKPKLEALITSIIQKNKK